MKKKRLQWKQRKEFQKPKNNKMLCGLIFGSMILLFCIAGCGEETPPSSLHQKGTSLLEKKKVEQAKSVEKRELDKKDVPEFTYNPSGKPDPFKPFIQLTSRAFPRSVPLTPLQKYEISQLKLVAIISVPEGNIALVEDAVGKGYFLKKGTEIGKNEGKVTKILKDKVIIEEVYQDILGQTKINEISLFLQQIEEGGES